MDQATNRMRILGCEEIADRYGVKISTVWRRIRDGRIPAKREGREYLVNIADLRKCERRDYNIIAAMLKKERSERNGTQGQTAGDGESFFRTGS